MLDMSLERLQHVQSIFSINLLCSRRSLWKCIDREEALGQSPGTCLHWGVGVIRKESVRRLPPDKLEERVQRVWL